MASSLRVRALALVPALVVLALFTLALGDGGRDLSSLALVQTAIFVAVAGVVWVGPKLPRAVTWPFLGVLMVIALSTLWSVRPESSVLHLLTWMMYLGVFIITAATLRGLTAARWFVDGAIVVGGWLCLVALFMFWGANNPDMRWYATFYWPNPFAAFLLLVLPLALARFLDAPRVPGALVYGLLALLLCVALVFTQSRGAWVALGATTLLAVMFLRPLHWGRGVGRMTVLVILTGLAVFALSQGTASRNASQGIAARAVSVTDSGDYSIQGRLNFWRAGLEIFLDHPLFGTGAGTFGSVHPAYQRDVRYYARDPHSLYIQTMTEMGIAGLVPLVALLASIGMIWRRTLQTARGKDEFPLIAGIGLGLVAFFLHSAFDMDWMFPANPAMAFALAGVLVWYDFSHPVGGATGPELTVQASDRTMWTRGVVWSRAVALPMLVLAVTTIYTLSAAQRHATLGQEAAGRGQWSLATDHYAAAVRGNPLSSRYLDAYAGVLVRIPEPRYALAADMLRRAMARDRMNASLPLHLAWILTAADSTPAVQHEAENLLRYALTLDRLNRPEIYRALAHLYQQQGRMDEAERVYREAIDLYAGKNLGQGSALYLLLWPEVVGVFQDAANLSVGQGKFDQAARILEQLLVEAPATVDAVVQLSDLYIKLDRPADARALLETTARRVPTDPLIVKALNALP